MGEIRRNGGLQDPALPAGIPPHHFIRIELGQMMGKGLAGGILETGALTPYGDKFLLRSSKNVLLQWSTSKPCATFAMGTGKTVSNHGGMDEGAGRTSSSTAVAQGAAQACPPTHYPPGLVARKSQQTLRSLSHPTWPAEKRPGCQFSINTLFLKENSWF